MSICLALDQATTCGWACGPTGAQPPVLRWGARRFDGEDCRGSAISRFRLWLAATIRQHGPDLVLSEAPYIPGLYGSGPKINAHTLRLLYGYSGEIEAVCWELRVPWEERTPGQISKFFTGRAAHGGRERKKAAFIATCHSFGWDTDDNDNVADALGLWCMGEAMLDPAASQRRGDGRLFGPNFSVGKLVETRLRKTRGKPVERGLFD